MRACSLVPHDTLLFMLSESLLAVVSPVSIGASRTGLEKLARIAWAFTKRPTREREHENDNPPHGHGRVQAKDSSAHHAQLSLVNDRLQLKRCAKSLDQPISSPCGRPSWSRCTSCLDTTDPGVHKLGIATWKAALPTAQMTPSALPPRPRNSTRLAARSSCLSRFSFIQHNHPLPLLFLTPSPLTPGLGRTNCHFEVLV